jgi:NAD(P)-dependent dehydrogenase (short-subunit alcohol dehydrogenase family)
MLETTRGSAMAKPQYDFQDRRVVVVGASRAGIGAAIADGFAECGAHVTITGIEASPIEHYVGRYPYRQLDVTDEAAIARFAAETPQLDVLINCAGMGSRETEWTNQGFRHVLNVNLVGMLNLANAFKPQLEASQGAVVAIASMYSVLGSPIIPAYGASKAGLAQLVKSLALAWAPAKVRVNAVAPGFIVTEQTVKGRADKAHYNRVLERTPMQRWGEPDDLVGPALFLASEQAKFVTGILLPVDGGLLAAL